MTGFMRKPAQYVATVRKEPFFTYRYRDVAEVKAARWEVTSGNVHRVLPNKRRGEPFAIWEFIPRRRLPAFYE